MSGQPPQRQTPAVYRRRRITVLVALVVIVALIWWGVSALFGPDDAAAGTGGADAQGGASSEETVSPDATASPEASPDASVSPASAASSPAPSPSEDAAAQIEACAPEAILVTVGTEPTVAGDKVTFSVDVTNSSAAPCLFAGDGDDTSLLVTSGDTRVWSSADCDATAAVVGKRWVLDAGAAESFDVSWPRTWSFEGCTEATGTPQPGTYWAALTVGGVDAERVPFTM